MKTNTLGIEGDLHADIDQIDLGADNPPRLDFVPQFIRNFGANAR